MARKSVGPPAEEYRELWEHLVYWGGPYRDPIQHHPQVAARPSKPKGRRAMSDTSTIVKFPSARARIEKPTVRKTDRDHDAETIAAISNQQGVMLKMLREMSEATARSLKLAYNNEQQAAYEIQRAVAAGWEDAKVEK